jgi:hypothetical protein
LGALVIVISLVTVATDRDELPQKLVTSVFVSEVVNLSCGRSPAALANAAGAVKNELPSLAPLVGLEIRLIPLLPFFRFRSALLL